MRKIFLLIGCLIFFCSISQAKEEFVKKFANKKMVINIPEQYAKGEAFHYVTKYVNIIPGYVNFNFDKKITESELPFGFARINLNKLRLTVDYEAIVKISPLKKVEKKSYSILTKDGFVDVYYTNTIQIKFLVLNNKGQKVYERSVNSENKVEKISSHIISFFPDNASFEKYIGEKK